MSASATKTVVLHYHLFKNAGTSIDSSFKDALNDGEWLTREFSGSIVEKRKELHTWISENKKVKCFSSHTAALPPPQISNVDILPVLFIRHPLDRIASAYAFEKNQNSSTFGSVLARNTTISGYIETRLSIKNDFQCRNFHAMKLAEMTISDMGSLEDRALHAISELPFIGVVEEFDQSIDKLQALLDETSLNDIKISVSRKNISQNSQGSLDEKLERLRIRIGDSLYRELENVNEVDCKIFEVVRSEYLAEA